ncbi:ATP-binding cassette domain-containing protein [Streptomyces sp. NPDC097619]|uniref:ABC transporter ATP-binding protein n=1 Tax=Streptomyces sp. NPDC097619 TaxID=3157228 RepID=UPI00331B0EFA
MVAPPDNAVLWAGALHYSHAGSPGLTDVSVAVRPGEVLAVTGPRGSGKTTLLHCLSGRIRPDEGEVWFDGVPIHTMGAALRERLRRDRFGWIGPTPQLVPELNVWENAALPLLLAGARNRAAKRAACAWLDRLDIGAHARRRIDSLDRSEAQRLALARALVAEPTVVFADEPAASLHRADGAQLLRTLTTAARTHEITVVLTGHDPDPAVGADRTVELLDGRTVTVGAPATEPEGRPECSLSV